MTAILSLRDGGAAPPGTTAFPVRGRVAVPDGDQARHAWRMRHMIYGHLRSRALCAMAEFGLADLLAAGPRGSADLARASGTSPAQLERLLRALVAFGVLREAEGRGASGCGYALTALGDTLRSDAPASALPTALLVSRAVAPAWDRLTDTVRGGAPAFPEVHGRDFFGHLDGDPELRAVFDRSQETGLALELEGVLGTFGGRDTGTGSGTETVVDVGGGDGAMLVGLLDALPGLRGVLVDLAAALPAARRRVAEAGHEERCTLVEGDFFGVLPRGGDTYLLRHVLHDWDDAACLAVLRNCRAAMGEGTRLVVVDHLMAQDAAGDHARWGAMMDLYMMALFDGGRERGSADVAALLGAAGFAVAAVTRLPGGTAVIEARPTREADASDVSSTSSTPDASSTSSTPDGTEATVRRWLREYVAQPHEQLGREGAVCPFVAPAIQADTLRLRTRRGFGDATADDVRALVREMARDFLAARWPHSNPTLHTLLLALPDLPRARWHLLDDVQAAVKPELAQQGLMLGQFHPECAEPAARNPGFPVSRSPLPLLALRRMALHDVLFLHQDPELFEQYRLRFGARYERGAAVDPLFRQVYEARTRQLGVTGRI